MLFSSGKSKISHQFNIFPLIYIYKKYKPPQNKVCVQYLLTVGKINSSFFSQKAFTCVVKWEGVLLIKFSSFLVDVCFYMERIPSGTPDSRPHIF